MIFCKYLHSLNYIRKTFSIRFELYLWMNLSNVACGTSILSSRAQRRCLEVHLFRTQAARIGHGCPIKQQSSPDGSLMRLRPFSTKHTEIVRTSQFRRFLQGQVFCACLTTVSTSYQHYLIYHTFPCTYSFAVHFLRTSVICPPLRT